MAQWIQGAVSKMKEKGTLGSFGKYTAKKVASAKKESGNEEKKAIFAQNMHKIGMKKLKEKAK